MAFKLDLKALLILGMLTGACGEDSPTPSDDEDSSDESSDSKTKDAGKKDAGKDAGKKDASSTDDDDSSDDATDDEPSDDDDSSDEPAASKDAGKDSGKGDAGSAPADCSALTYEKFAKTFFANYCLSCHDKMEPTYNTLEELTPYVDEMKMRVLDPMPAALLMPPKGLKAPTAAEKTKFGQWIDCGAK